MWQVEVSHKSEMAGPFNRGDTIIKQALSLYFFINFQMQLFCWRFKFCVYTDEKAQDDTVTFE